MMEAAQVHSKITSFNGSEGNKLSSTIYFPPAFEDNATPDRPPIILMHGGGQTRHSWHGTAQLLALRGHLALTVDARGHGDSDWLDSQNYSFDYFCSDLIDLTQQVEERWSVKGIAPILVGASMGGISAMLAQDSYRAEHGTELFSSIVLVDITPRMEKTGVERIMGFMAKDMRRGFASIEEAAEAVSAYMPNRKRPTSHNGLRKNLRHREDGRWYWHWDPAFVDGKSNISTGREDRLETLYRAVSSIAVPTLLVRGGNSELVSKEAAEEFLELVPHAKYVDVTGAGHMVAGDKNDVFANAVLEFLDAGQN